MILNKTEILARIIHDLKTPLNAKIAYIEVSLMEIDENNFS